MKFLAPRWIEAQQSLVPSRAGVKETTAISRFFLDRRRAARYPRRVPRDRIVRRKYSNVLPGVGVVVVLVAAISAITVVQMHWLGWMQWSQSLEPGLSESRVLPASPPPSDRSGLSPGPASFAPQVAEAEGAPPSGVSPQPAPTAAAKRAATGAQGPRFAVEFGPFLTGTEAERIERQINEAGYQTVRFRVAAQPGEVQTALIRHGNFVSRHEAEDRGGELERLGLSNYVVRTK
jgi:hypothetical protein